MVDAQGRNQIAVAPGANHRLTVEMVEPYAESIAWAEVVACQLETPLPVVRWALGEARRHGVIAVLNPAPVQPLDGISSPSWTISPRTSTRREGSPAGR